MGSLIYSIPAAGYKEEVLRRSPPRSIMRGSTDADKGIIGHRPKVHSLALSLLHAS